MMGAKRSLLIFLTIIILGPIVFIGACLPISTIGFSLGWDGGNSLLATTLFYGGWIVGVGLAVLICGKVIKRIKRNDPQTR